MESKSDHCEAKKSIKIEERDTLACVNNQNGNGKKARRVRNKVKSQAKKLLPAEVIHSVKPTEKKLSEKTTTKNGETERIRIKKNTLDSKSSIVSKQLTESRVTKKVLDVEKSNIKETPMNSSPRPAISSISKNDERPSTIVGEEQPAGQLSDTTPIKKKVYSKSFLLKIENVGICQKKSDTLKDWDIINKSSNPVNCVSGTTASNFSSRLQQVNGTGLLPSYSTIDNNSHCHKMPQTLQSVITQRNNGQEKIAAKSKIIHFSLSSRNEVKLNRTENAWIPTIVAKNAAATTNVDASTKCQQITTEEVNKNVRSMLNKITPDNIVILIKSFLALPIDTIERLENTIDIIFEKAIQEQSFAPLYAAVCSAMQNVRVSCPESKKTMLFKMLIIKKCQNLFELDKTQQLNSVTKSAEINSCRDLEKKKELILEYEENERRLRKRSVGNCRFIGELFKQNMLNPNIMLYCMKNLVNQHSEEPLECLCNLLKTTGKELELCCNLNDTFNKLRDLTSDRNRSKISSRIRFMIHDIIDLRRDKWLPRHLESKPKMINEIEKEVENETMVQAMASSSYKSEMKQPHNRANNKVMFRDNINHRGNNNNRNIETNIKCKQPNYIFDQHKLQRIKDISLVKTLGPSRKWSFTCSPSSSKKNCETKPAGGVANVFQPKFNDRASRPPLNSELGSAGIAKKIVTVLNTVQAESDSEVNNKIHTLCKNIIEEFEQMHNLDDVIYSLVEDKNSCIRTKHQQFVTSTLLIILNGSSNRRTEVGKMFDELLSKKVLSMTDITRGLDTVLKDWNDYLTDYPYFFSYVAAIVAPLMISKTASFEFFNLKNACTSIRPDNSSMFFVEVLQTILRTKNTENAQNVKNFGDTIWIYNMWKEESKHVSLDVFVPNNQINKFFKNDRVGVLLLSMAMFDKTRLIGGNKSLYDTTHKWINKNINAETIKLPCFVRTLTIATVIVCSNKPKDDLNEDFFDRGRGKLLNYYIQSVSNFSTSEIRAREVQCLKGNQILLTALQKQQDSGDMDLRPFCELYRDHAISRKSLDAWKDEVEFDKNSTKTVAVLNSLFLKLDSKK